MLEIKLDGLTYWYDEDEDESKHHFVDLPSVTIKLEHSLVSISKWEMKYKKPYLEENAKRTYEEELYYIKCMTLNYDEIKAIEDELRASDSTIEEDIFYKLLTPQQRIDIQKYQDDPMSATWFYKKENEHGKKSIVTSEVIYYWLVAQQIPFEVQYWHFNRLLTLVNVCNDKNTPKKKRPIRDVLQEQYRLNEERLKKFNTTG